MNKADLAKLVDHTLLKPEATTADVEKLIDEGAKLGVWSVCVSPTFVRHAKDYADGRVKVCTVVGFPSGKVVSSIKAAEALQAVMDGADEVDMVIDVGMAKEHKFPAVTADIQAVRQAIPGTLLKVIIESAALTDAEIVEVCKCAEAAKADFVKTSTGFHPSGGATPHAVEPALTDAEIVEVCKCAEAAKADFVKTSTGFHPSGGATPHAVELMAKTVGHRLGVKASGGVRTLADAEAVTKAGATRLGLSGTAAVLAGFDGATPQPSDSAGY